MLTRMFKHVAAWATASFEDVILPNPKFSESPLTLQYIAYMAQQIALLLL